MSIYHLCSRFVFIFLMFCMGISAMAGRADSIAIYSKAMQQNQYFTIITPNPAQQDSVTYPVLYLLHGYGGRHNSWLTKVPELLSMADEFQTIIVCPDGGFNSWYFNSPLIPASQYETFIAIELPAFIDAMYPTIRQPQGRGIGGLSMGGHGAFYLAMRHPNVFGTATTMSGVVDLTSAKGKYEIVQKIGPEAEWNQYSILTTMDSTNARMLNLFIDCGSSDTFIEGNRKLHQKLLNQQVLHAYMERPGGHTWTYWKESLPYHLTFFRQQWSSIAR